MRLGVRYKFLGHDDFEHGDIELDGTWEGWNWAEGDGDKIQIDSLGPFSDIHPTLTHHYMDTYSIRLGGAYNIRLPAGVFTLRLGGFFDSAATKYKDTRVDFDTMAHYGGTAGLGYSVRGITLNIAYAYMYEPDRNVTNGDIQSINGVANGSTNTTAGPTPVVNNGLYHAQEHDPVVRPADRVGRAVEKPQDARLAVAKRSGSTRPGVEGPFRDGGLRRARSRRSLRSLWSLRAARPRLVSSLASPLRGERSSTLREKDLRRPSASRLAGRKKGCPIKSVSIL